jgi:hypothetical protein
MCKSVHQRDEAGADFQVAILIEPLAQVYQLIVDPQQFVEVVSSINIAGGT